MKNNFTAVLAVMLGLAACGKKVPAPEQPAAAPAQTEAAAAQVGVSTGSQLGAALNAPGNYLRGMVGNIDKAKKAAADSNKKEEELINMDPSKETGN
ncbi:MAG: hypothetical protein WCK76_00900 [Elusimicrobiota bacterium]